MYGLKPPKSSFRGEGPGCFGSGAGGGGSSHARGHPKHNESGLRGGEGRIDLCAAPSVMVVSPGTFTYHMLLNCTSREGGRAAGAALRDQLTRGAEAASLSALSQPLH